MASVPAVSIAVKRPGPVKSEEDVEDFFNALDSGSQMAVESQYVHQSKRTMEKRNPNALQKLDALDEKEEMDLMDEVDRMEMEIEASFRFEVWSSSGSSTYMVPDLLIIINNHLYNII